MLYYHSIFLYLPASHVDLEYSDKMVHVTMVPNPSHLEVRLYKVISHSPGVVAVGNKDIVQHMLVT